MLSHLCNNKRDNTNKNWMNTINQQYKRDQSTKKWKANCFQHNTNSEKLEQIYNRRKKIVNYWPTNLKP